ncbi:MAG: efflux RND transporter periplasmic adaptor subunit [Gemmataceae bacterium]
MSRVVKIGGGLAVVVAVIVTGAAVRGRPKTPVDADAPAPSAPKRAIAVSTSLVTPRSMRREVSVVGSLWGRDEVPVSAKVEGRVVRIHHDVGDTVKPGDVLFDLDPTDYRLAVQEAERGLELELSRLGLKTLPTTEFDPNALPSVAKARAVEKNALARRDRVVKIGGGASTAEEKDLAQTEYDVAKTNTQQAILEAQSTLASARQKAAALESAKQKLADTSVRVTGDAKVRYVVCQRLIAEGEMVRTVPGPTAMHQIKLVIDDPLKFQATVPERHRGVVKIGQAVEIEVEAYAGEKFTGKVARVNPTIDRANRTFQVEIHVPNADRRLAAGSFAKAAIISHIDESAKTVPEEALVSFAGVTKLFAIREARAVAVAVTVGPSMVVDGRTWVEVTGDLKAGEAVAASGQGQLFDGVAIRVREAGHDPK